MRTCRSWRATLEPPVTARLPRADRLQDRRVGAGAGRAAAIAAARGLRRCSARRGRARARARPRPRSSRSPTVTRTTATSRCRSTTCSPRSTQTSGALLIGEEASGGAPPGPRAAAAARRLPASELGAGEPTRGDTVHLDVADRFGNLLSATPSGGWLQSSPTIPALGWPLGTRAQMFWLEEGLPSSLEPRKRPRTTLSPGLVLRGGEPWLAWGTPGGDQQEQWASARSPAPRRPRARPAGGDRRARVAHRPPDLVVLSAQRRAALAGGRVAVRRRRDRRAAPPRARRHRRGAVVARPGQRRRPAGGQIGAAANARGMQGYAVAR